MNGYGDESYICIFYCMKRHDKVKVLKNSIFYFTLFTSVFTMRLRVEKKAHEMRPNGLRIHLYS